MRLFLDANVIFTAAYTRDGRSPALFELAARGTCTLVASTHAVDEARRNVTVKAVHALPRLGELLARVEHCPEADRRLVTWAAGEGLPEGDAPILAAAVGARVDVLVTSDRRHFGHLFRRLVAGVWVCSPAEALGAVLGAVRG